ncbi:hypothetical protein [Bacteroides sp. 51]|uniref:hypothetical protein n=1 Tax=Bacteroides sp. 51 TaxID=2302938 RepID=UPI0013D132AA|nr:hypothetical protein [Bacteroides sp. 51]NDV84139.1 hypothetical protein [Bacteroides sp. 51]
MRQYVTGKTGLARLLTVALTTSLLTVLSCSDEFEKTDDTHNLSMAFSTRAGETAAEQIPTMRLFTFHDDFGGTDDKKFYKEILNMKRTTDKITAQVEAGHKWNMALVSTPNGGTIIAPEVGKHISEMPLYKYEPTYPVGGKSSDAHEMYLDNQLTPTISANALVTMPAQLNRTVAKVNLIIKQTTPNFKLSSAKHKIKLHYVPSTISYTGDLLPSAANPDTLSKGLEAPVTLEVANSTSYKGTEVISFIIPAHRGDAYTSATPTDLVGVKMGVEVILERTGGTMFDKQEEISIVAQCNKVLEVEITVNDGLEFKTSVLNWEGVGMESTVGAGYQNWLYVKKDATGNGLSWSDPLPNINAAITKAGLLKTAGKTVNGILVAGGSSLVYSESLDIPANIKIYGGWKGEKGTELAASDAVSAVYASAGRDLSTYKTRLTVGTGNVKLTKENTVLDGFIVSGTGSASDALVAVSHSTAWLNAVEIDQQTSLAATYALSVSNGVATNVLASRNNKGVAVTATGKLVNATIANNTATASSVFSGTLLNSIYWGNAGSVSTAGTVNYCAFQGATAPTGTNYPLNATNNAWFTNATISVPGPHFNQTTNAAVPYYSVNTSTPNRAPQLARGDQASFDNVTPAMLAVNKQDIYGNPRHHNGTDIGCYESTGTQKGFEFRWNMTDIYISPKVLIESDHLALLFDNSEGAYVQWEATDFVIISSRYSVVAGTTSGSGNTVNLGSFKLKSSATKNSGNGDLNCGSLVFKCKNIDKSYFPDVPMTVYQSPAEPAVWNEGYAGSFHRWNETEPRYIFGEHLAGEEWTARIISGHDWIKIDGKPRPANPNSDTEVEETFGGVVTGTGNVIFRIGMKSTLASASSQPRYGLISITKRIKDYNNNTWTANRGSALFFVRQGEAADYLYGPDDDRALGTRTGAVKFSPYNLTEPNGGFNTAGISLGKNGGRFVDYPSKTGYFFKWNSFIAYYPDNSKTGTSMGTGYKSGNWDDANEPCPSGYFTPTDEQFVHSYFLNRSPANSGSGSAVGTTFVWGRLADGYYDKLATIGVRTVGSGPDRATEGLLMYNDYTNASVFFPMAGYRSTTSFSGDYIEWTQTSSPRATSTMWHTHSYGSGNTGHLGMSCTGRQRYDGLSVRCVKK